MVASKAASRRGSRSGLERRAWLFMRISGLMLLLLAVGHLLFMHVVTGVEVIDYAWIVRRWSHPAWRLYDWLLLALAIAHGTNGVRQVVEDHVPPGRASSAVKWLLLLASVAALFVGTIVLATAPAP